MITLNNQKLPRKLRAAVLEKPQSLKLKEISMWPIEEYGDPDMVLVKVKSCGICGSDLRYYKGENPWAQHSLGRYVPNPPNIVLGHEFSGDVVAVLSERNRYLLGKRVVPIAFTTCGRCVYCRTGRENLCPNTIHIGHGQGWGRLDYFPGAYAEYVPVWARGCYEIHQDLSYDEASMIDILTVCTHVAHQGSIKEGSPVLVIGCGPAGNGVAQVAGVMGASEVIVTERSDVPLDLAGKQGFDLIIDVRGKENEEIVRLVMDRTNDVYCTSIFDTVGTQETLDLGLSVLDKGGTLVNMAVHAEPMQINGLAISGERKITTSSNARFYEYPIALSWLAKGKLKVRNWLTNITLEEVPEAFEKMLGAKREFFKVVINPSK